MISKKLTLALLFLLSVGLNPTEGNVLSKKELSITELQRSLVDYLNRHYGKRYTHPLPMVIHLDNETFLQSCLANIGEDCEEVDSMYLPMEEQYYFGRILVKKSFDPMAIGHQALMLHELVHWVQHSENRGGKCGNEMEAYGIQNAYRLERGLKAIVGLPERCKYAP